MPSYIHKIREMIGHERIFLPGVRAIIVNQEGEILLQKRSDMDIWGLPGGVIELNETVLEALRREVWEETSLTVVEAEPMGVYCGPDHRYEYPHGDKVQCFAMAFIIKNWEGTPKVNDHESKAIQFYNYAEIPDNLFATQRITLNDYARYQGNFIVT
ncbi:NUDIX domain-containing protein [bacterium]|nr:NUDIX domain-containing protein [bacterium]